MPAHLVEAHHVVLAHESALAARVVDEHLRDGRLAARDQVRVRRNLLEQVALARTARTQLDEVVVALDERHHPQQHDCFRALAELRGLQPDRAHDRKSIHSASGESLAPFGEHVRARPTSTSGSDAGHRP
jgi:hypothetical protein